MSDTLVVRCEPDPENTFHCDALVDRWPDSAVCDLPAGEGADLERYERVVITGSSAGVYEDDEHDWLERGRELVREALERETAVLGVCFGHQLVNDALGGRVVHDQFRAGLVEATLDPDPLFEGVSSIVPILHGDLVQETGDGLEPIASAPGYEYPHFATRHERAPIWTVQFHPELRPELRPTLSERFDWTEGNHSFETVTAERTFDNFRRLTGAPTAERATDD